jgi:hypothetical protein
MTGTDYDPTDEERATWKEHLRTERRLIHYARFLVYVPFLALIALAVKSI